MKKTIALLGIASAGMLAAGQAGAQDAAAGYPKKPIRIIVPFPAGGTSDVLARMMGQKLKLSPPQSSTVRIHRGSGMLGFLR